MKIARRAASAMMRTVRSSINGRCLTFRGGIGDHLLLTIVAHEFRKRAIGNVFIISKYGELFKNNSDVTGIALPGSSWERLFLRLTGYDKYYVPRYDLDHDFENDIGAPPDEHIAAVMCRAVGITGEIEIRPVLRLTKAERRWGNRFGGAIAIQSGVMNATTPMPNKQWLPQRFIEVSKVLAASHEILQLGGMSDPLLPCSVDLRDKTSVRETASILANCRLFVGQVGFLMHLARAVDCPSVIIYGGRERPDQSGYSCNRNLYSAIECAPCWNYARCDFERKCMTMINVNHLIDAVSFMLDSARGPLPIDRVHIS